MHDLHTYLHSLCVVPSLKTCHLNSYRSLPGPGIPFSQKAYLLAAPSSKHTLIEVFPLGFPAESPSCFFKGRVSATEATTGAFSGTGPGGPGLWVGVGGFGGDARTEKLGNISLLFILDPFIFQLMSFNLSLFQAGGSWKHSHNWMASWAVCLLGADSVRSDWCYGDSMSRYPSFLTERFSTHSPSRWMQAIPTEGPSGLKRLTQQTEEPKDTEGYRRPIGPSQDPKSFVSQGSWSLFGSWGSE